ncbi:hypothetical protein TYRP_022930 [Tyrophagus putrescentiae]|nr:hypothetical protein TYRP_022930 [Tyrophagus putrescentiae]
MASSSRNIKNDKNSACQYSRKRSQRGGSPGAGGGQMANKERNAPGGLQLHDEDDEQKALCDAVDCLEVQAMPHQIDS